MPVNGCCRRCGRDAIGLDGEFLCEDCREYRPEFDRAASAVRFESEARDLISAFKFNGKLWLRDDLVDWLEGVLRARFCLGDIDIVLPMPSTVFHCWNRGYNQCVMLARPLARRIGRPCGRFVMRRRGHPRRHGAARGRRSAGRAEAAAGALAFGARTFMPRCLDRDGLCPG